MKQSKAKKPNPILSLFRVRWMLIFYDLLIYVVVVLFSFVLYELFKGNTINWLQVLYHFLLGAGLVILSRFFFKVYAQIWRYGGVQSYIRLMIADAVALILYTIAQRLIPGIITQSPWFTLALVVLNTMIALATRMVYRLLYKRLNRTTKFGKFIVKCINLFGRSDWSLDKGDPVNKIKIAIIGAGGVGIGLAEELLNNPSSAYVPAAFVDVDKDKLGRQIYGKDVLEDNDATPELLQEYDVQEVVLALPPRVSIDTRKELYDRYKNAGFKIKSYDYPTMQNTKKGKRALREFDVEDLLFRKEQEVITPETINYYKDKVVLVTGGGGSIGSEIARQLAKM